MASLSEPLPLPPGLVAVTDDEGAGKTHLLRILGERPSALWLDLSLPGRDHDFPEKVWVAYRRWYPSWSVQLWQDPVEALDLGPHLGKKLSMLSTGSRGRSPWWDCSRAARGSLALTSPSLPLTPSIRVICEFLTEVDDHTTRTWVVAHHEADARMPWGRQVTLP
jgi:hypothetical protein